MASRLARSLCRTLHSPGISRGLHAFRQVSSLSSDEFDSKSLDQLENGSRAQMDSDDDKLEDGSSNKLDSEDEKLEDDSFNKIVDDLEPAQSSRSDSYRRGQESLYGGAGGMSAGPQGIYKAILLGEVGNPPVQKIMRSGRSVTIFTVATGGMRNNRKPFDDETPMEYAQRSIVQWHRVAVYQERVGGLAMRYMRQGSQVYVEGNMETRIFNDPQTGVIKRVREVAIRQNGRLLFMDQATNNAAMNDRLSDNSEVKATI